MAVEKYVPKSPEERTAEKAKRTLEKALRVPLNDTILMVQDGTLVISDVIGFIEQRVKEGMKNG